MSCTGRCARSQSPDTSPADAGPINPPAHSGGGSGTWHPWRILGLGLLARGASEDLLAPPPRVQRGTAPCRGEYLPAGTPAATLTCLPPARALVPGVSLAWWRLGTLGKEAGAVRGPSLPVPSP